MSIDGELVDLEGYVEEKRSQRGCPQVCHVTTILDHVMLIGNHVTFPLHLSCDSHVTLGLFRSN